MSSQPPPLPNNEIARLDALHRYQILDTAPEKAFDDFTFLAAQICAAPIALIGFIDQNRQWFKSKLGLKITETCRDTAFCTYTILQQRLFIVRNALADPRFATNPLVTSDPNIRFYVGAPLVTPDGFVIGTLCVIDTVPRDLSPEQAEALRALSRQVLTQLELRLNVITLSRMIIERVPAVGQLRHQHDLSEFYHQGVDKAQRGDYLGAIADFDQFLGLNPHDAEAHLYRGLARCELGDYLGAIADYKQAIHHNPDYVVACYDRGVPCPELGDDQEVNLNYTESLQLNSNDTKAVISLGNGPVCLNESLKICPSCWTPGTAPAPMWTNEQAKYCFMCGTPLRNRCANCNELTVSLKFRFCPYCGSSYKESIN